jgi:hypothetical protein
MKRGSKEWVDAWLQAYLKQRNDPNAIQALAVDLPDLRYFIVLARRAQEAEQPAPTETAITPELLAIIKEQTGLEPIEGNPGWWSRPACRGCGGQGCSCGP